MNADFLSATKIDNLTYLLHAHCLSLYVASQPLQFTCKIAIFNNIYISFVSVTSVQLDSSAVIKPCDSFV